MILRTTSHLNAYKLIPKFESNIGDDINFVLAPWIFNKYIVPYEYSLIGRRLLKQSNVLFIGSIINGLSTNRSIVLGAGLSPDFNTGKLVPPKSIKCVRGPLTRNYLKERGIECPEVYGDPALIFPLFYTPKLQNRRYKIGFILHFLDRRDSVFNFLAAYDDCLILDVVNYGKWENFIDKLCSCDLIFSSSLHGLILADAYKIPNVWTQFYFQVNPFKYHDYFMSVGRVNEKPFILNNFIDIKCLMKNKDHYQIIRFDKKYLLDFLRLSSDYSK